MTVNTYKTLFESGQFKALTESFEARSKSNWRETGSLVIGAYYYLGDRLSAEALFTKYESQLSSTEKAQAYFFKLIYETRVSKYKESRQTLAKLIRIYRHQRKNSAFFVYQALGFFYFYRSKLKTCLHWSEKAYRASHQNDDRFQLFLATDLLGHGLFLSGEIQIGLARLEEAKKLAAILGHDGYVYSIDVSLAIYTSQISADIAGSATRLQNTISALVKPNDNHSAANLYLQLAQLRILNGQFAEAETVLNKVSVLIFRASNRRQAALLNFRYGYLNHLRGENILALQFLKNAEGLLDETVDHALLIKVYGLQARLLKPFDAEEAERRHQLSAAREQSTGINVAVSTPQNPLGQVIHQLKSPATDEHKIKLALKHKILFLMPEILHFKLKSNALVVLANQLLLATTDKIEILESTTSPVMRRLLAILGEGKKTKYDLLEQVWQRDLKRYDPEVDDPLVFSNFTRLRKILGAAAHLLVSDESGYWLNAKIFAPSNAPIEFNISAAKQSLLSAKRLKDLNWRQTEGFLAIRERGYIGVGDYRRIFKISEATARRDLVDLEKKGLVNRQGRGRATTYCVF